MIGRRLVNGVEGAGIAADDRGLQYGDGLFETMAVVDGRIRHFDLHMARLAEGCHRLGMPAPPDRADREPTASKRWKGLGSAVVKLILTRGPGPRGYPPPLEAQPDARHHGDGRASAGGGSLPDRAGLRDAPRAQPAPGRHEAPQSPRAGAGGRGVARSAASTKA